MYNDKQNKQLEFDFMKEPKITWTISNAATSSFIFTINNNSNDKYIYEKQEKLRKNKIYNMLFNIFVFLFSILIYLIVRAF